MLKSMDLGYLDLHRYIIYMHKKSIKSNTKKIAMASYTLDI